MGHLFCRKEIVQHPTVLNDWQTHAFKSFVDKLVDQNKKFPCLPAIQGFHLDHFRYGFIENPRDKNCSFQLATLLEEYSIHSREYGNHTSLIVFCETPDHLIQTNSILDYEHLFWNLLNKTIKHDKLEWPSHIPRTPNHSEWEYCFHNEQYFVYCGTPFHFKRQSRNFPCLLFAFTPRWILQEFQSNASKASKMKKMIRTRLSHYDTIEAHPDLNMYGNEDNFEWKQYFLRDDQSTLTKCPFMHHHRTHNEKKS